MKRILILLFLLSFHFCKAQINESDTLKFQLRTTLTGNLQTGNVKLTVIRGKLDFTYAPKPLLVFKTQNNSLYQAFAAKADNDVFSRNYLYFKPENRIYPYAIAYVSTNFRRKIDSRFFGGVGATWQMINNSKHIVKLSANTVYESTQFNGSKFNYLEFNGANKLQTWRGTVYLSGFHYLLEKHLRLYYDAYWQPAFNNSNDYRIEYDIGLEFPIYKGFSFNALYAYKFENVVVDKIKTNDTILTFGLAYNLKK